MQKIPRFGEKTVNYDKEKEEKCLDLLKEFLNRSKPVKNRVTCQPKFDWDMVKTTKDVKGIRSNYGSFANSKHYLSPEEAFFLSTKKLLMINPIDILVNTNIFFQKILLYSLLKRKGTNISFTSLAESLNKNLGIKQKHVKFDENFNETQSIKSPDDILDLNTRSFYICEQGAFERINIEKWNPLEESKSNK